MTPATQFIEFNESSLTVGLCLERPFDISAGSSEDAVGEILSAAIRRVDLDEDDQDDDDEEDDDEYEDDDEEDEEEDDDEEEEDEYDDEDEDDDLDDDEEDDGDELNLI